MKKKYCFILCLIIPVIMCSCSRNYEDTSLEETHNSEPLDNTEAMDSFEKQNPNLGIHYIEESEDTFKLILSESSLWEDILYFDYEYYSRWSDNYINYLFILYEKNDEFYIKRIVADDNNSDNFSINLESEKIIGIISELAPTLTDVNIITSDRLKVITYSIKESKTTSSYNLPQSEGWSNKPLKVIIELNEVLNNSELQFTDGKDVVVKTTTIKFHIN